MIENDVQPEVGEPLETFHIYPMGDGFFVRKEEEQVIDSTPVRQPRDNHTLIMMSVCSCVMALLVLCIPNSPITQQVTIVHAFSIPKDIQSYSLAPVTRTASQIVATTGKGHTAATVARGYLTLYNGSFTAQDIPQNMIFTTGNGIQVVTDSPVSVPAGNPPTYGQISVPSHALSAGVAGNIRAYAIDTACCFSAVKAINEAPFSGGRDARDYHTVRQQDIKAPAIQPSYALSSDAVLIHGTCSTRVVTNHHIGEEATNIRVTTFETCTGSAFSKKSLEARARELVRIPRDFRLDRLSVTVVYTTPTSVLASIQYTTFYSFSQKKEW